MKIESFLRAEAGVRRERRDSSGRRLGSELVLGEPANRTELARIEKALGWSFPQAYLQCVTEVGLLHLDSYWDEWGPQNDGRFLTPAEISEILAAFTTWVEDCCSEFEEDPEGAAAEQAVRDTLVPFQFIGDGTSRDVYCFVRGDEREGEVRIIPAYHDDEDMGEWEKQEDARRIYGFADHVQNWLSGRGDEPGP